MAKTFHKPIDKLERQARLEQRNARNDRREQRNINRMGWQPEPYDDFEEDERERGDET